MIPTSSCAAPDVPRPPGCPICHLQFQTCHPACNTYVTHMLCCSVCMQFLSAYSLGCWAEDEMSRTREALTRNASKVGGVPNVHVKPTTSAMGLGCIVLLQAPLDKNVTFGTFSEPCRTPNVPPHVQAPLPVGSESVRCCQCVRGQRGGGEQAVGVHFDGLHVTWQQYSLN